jgi:hypothetical protein
MELRRNTGVGNQAQLLRPVAFARQWFLDSIFTSGVRRKETGRLFPLEKTRFAELSCAE